MRYKLVDKETFVLVFEINDELAGLLRQLAFGTPFDRQEVHPQADPEHIGAGLLRSPFLARRAASMNRLEFGDSIKQSVLPMQNVRMGEAKHRLNGGTPA